MKEEYDNLVNDITEIYKQIDIKLAKDNQTLIKPTPEAIASLTATVLINHEKNQRVKDMKAERKPQSQISKEEIMTELYKMRDGEPAYPIEMKEENGLIIVNKTVQNLDRELWDDVNTKVKSFGGRWHAKPKHRWEIKV